MNNKQSIKFYGHPMAPISDIIFITSEVGLTSLTLTEKVSYGIVYLAVPGIILVFSTFVLPWVFKVSSEELPIKKKGSMIMKVFLFYILAGTLAFLLAKSSQSLQSYYELRDAFYIEPLLVTVTLFVVYKSSLRYLRISGVRKNLLLIAMSLCNPAFLYFLGVMYWFFIAN